MTGATARWMRLDLPVWVALAVMLAGGWAVLRAAEARSVSFADPQGSLRLTYPAGWLAVPGSANLLEVQDPLSGAAAPTALIVVRESRPPDRSLDMIVTDGILARSQTLAMYRVLRQQPLQVAGREALAVEYAFVADPHEAVLAAERLPVVVRGVEVVALADGAVYRIDLRAASGRFDRGVLDRILRDVRL